VLLVLLALVLFTFSGSTSGSTATYSAPTLRLITTSPLVVRGRHFRPGETVRVVADAGKTKRVRATRPSATGSFRVSFGAMHADRCTEGLLITATGPRERAVLKLPSPECAVP
jgi:hypothetical protein